MKTSGEQFSLMFQGLKISSKWYGVLECKYSMTSRVSRLPFIAKLVSQLPFIAVVHVSNIVI